LDSENPEGVTGGYSTDKLCMEIPVDLEKIDEVAHEDSIPQLGQIEEE